MVACPSCPDHSPEPPGPIIRNMLGWSQMEKRVRSWVLLFRSALEGEKNLSSLCAAGDWRDRTTLRGRSLGIPRVLVRMRTGEAPLWATYWRAVLATAGRCVEGYRTPDEALVC